MIGRGAAHLERFATGRLRRQAIAVAAMIRTANGKLAPLGARVSNVVGQPLEVDGQGVWALLHGVQKTWIPSARWTGFEGTPHACTLGYKVSAKASSQKQRFDQIEAICNVGNRVSKASGGQGA